MTDEVRSQVEGEDEEELAPESEDESDEAA